MRGTAIVIDDDHPTVEMLSEFLEMKGMKVIGRGYTGIDAVELYKKSRPDFVLLDIMMPVYDGFYVLEQIRIFDPGAKIIVVTADLRDDTVSRLDKLNIPYINKPYEFEQLVNMIKQFY